MNFCRSLLSGLFLAWASMVAAQPSTICHEDGTVTFQYKNDQAKEVLVDVQFAGRNPMKRNAATGLWEATLGPAAPDMYPYCFIVDGVSVMDPENPQYFPNEGFKNSLLEIPAKGGKLAHDIVPPQGQRQDWFCMADYHVFSSENLSDWTDHGVILSQEHLRDEAS